VVSGRTAPGAGVQDLLPDQNFLCHNDIISGHSPPTRSRAADASNRSLVNGNRVNSAWDTTGGEVIHMSDNDGESDSGPSTGDETTASHPVVKSDYKVKGEQDAPAGTGVLGHNTATSGISTYGVQGVTDSVDPDSAGVSGTATSSSGKTHGVHGRSEADIGKGVTGFATAASGTNHGVLGVTFSNEGYGVYSAGRLHAERDVDKTGATNMDRHVATFHNTSGSSTGDILGLKTDVDDPGEFMNYISFIDADAQIGQIDGNGSGGVTYDSASSDLAEYFPKADPDAAFEAGDVVGLQGGALVADPTAGDVALVISGAPMVTGNVPMNDDGNDLACVALLGQVEVRVGGSVHAGDVLVATAVGTAVPAAAGDESAPVVGRALEAGDAHDVVESFVTARAYSDRAPARDRALEGHLAEKDARIDELEAENEALRTRLAAVEEYLGLDDAEARPTLADD
jgi:hypothetical protein